MGERARETLIRRYAVDVAGSAFVDVWTALLDKQPRHA
jgi:hypothetical protein